MYTHNMDESRIRAEQLLTLSSAGRRLSDLVSAAEAPLRYEVMRHLLRVSEETMTETLEEVVEIRLVRRGPDPFTYVPFDDPTGDAIRASMDPDRLTRLRSQIASATARVFE
jgi:hypothetical protein